MRPLLSEKLFPVGRVSKKRPIGRPEISPPPVIFFYKLECTGKRFFFFENKKTKVQFSPFSPLGQWTGNNSLFAGGLYVSPPQVLLANVDICRPTMRVVPGELQ